MLPLSSPDMICAERSRGVIAATPILPIFVFTPPLSYLSPVSLASPVFVRQRDSSR